jgi:trans-aconitate 2-methyltransferase
MAHLHGAPGDNWGTGGRFRQNGGEVNTLAAERRDVWNPDLYGKFREERAAPFMDLLLLVDAGPGPRVLDLGCGTGELTRLAHERLGARETVGVDASAAMLERAAAQAGGGLSFRHGDLAAFADGGFDVVLSNAAIHWVPDHAALLPRLAALLAPGGQLAIQAPANDQHPSHALARDVAREPEHAAALGGFVRESPLLEPERYARLLFHLGLARQRVRLETYAHPLASRDEVVEWVRWTLLTDYERRLDAQAWARFLARYRELLLGALPDERPFVYTYRRLFLWGRLP